MTLDQNIEIAATGVQAALIGFLVFRGIFKKLPLFSSYVIWLFLIPGAISVLSNRLSSQHSYEHIFLAASILDAIFMLCVLVELSMSVLSPIRSSLPRWTFAAVGVLLALIFAAIWPFAKPRGYVDLLSVSKYIVHFDIATSVLRIAFFLGLAACSQLLSIGWRDRELQVATGLGFYSFVGLAASVVQMNLGTAATTMETYHLLNRIPVVGYILCSIYWIVSFAQKVPERREFTPQMEKFLLALAGNAQATRIAMRDTSTKFKKKDDE
jgi:hypothetical protein